MTPRPRFSRLVCLAAAVMLAGCSAQQVATTFTAAQQVDQALVANAQAKINAMPAGSARTSAQNRLNSAQSDFQLGLLIAEVSAPLIVKPATQPAAPATQPASATTGS